ncbi:MULTISPECIES: hypothetical protein [Leclercia]|uniref:hypothetical protein n=1 Tax=Leclercia TaxID=83654 RepID=UPI000DF340E6|nr:MULTISPECIES: hypothetical protein [Leclercia]AXF60237.1 hypothetical protein DVA43_12160 [Leclercia sp. W6]AXF65862.1 hypothetical protein DVA44_18060 [Leclercia sp. W17]WNY88279.1 hypothetical protein NRF19_04925 [Leclercia adecarboxylata]
MGIIKKILLAIVIIAGVLNISRQAHEYGLDIGLQLLTVFILSTAFLWRWASGYLPHIGKSVAITIMMVTMLIARVIVEYAIADHLHVDLVEVIHTSLKYSPWLWLAMFLGSGVKVFFWRWLFAGVRQENRSEVTA